MLLLSLAACDAIGIQPARQAELVGEWDWTDENSRFRHSCGSLVSVKYFANGTYYVSGELGSWRQQGDDLIDVTTSLLEIHDEATAELIGETYVSTLRWADQNTLVKHYSDGPVRVIRRCPSSD